MQLTIHWFCKICSRLLTVRFGRAQLHFIFDVIIWLPVYNFATLIENIIHWLIIRGLSRHAMCMCFGACGPITRFPDHKVLGYFQVPENCHRCGGLGRQAVPVTSVTGSAWTDRTWRYFTSVRILFWTCRCRPNGIWSTSAGPEQNLTHSYLVVFNINIMFHTINKKTHVPRLRTSCERYSMTGSFCPLHLSSQLCQIALTLYTSDNF